jgi:hypothetical protein
MRKSWRAGFALRILCCGGVALALAGMLGTLVPSALPPAKAAQVRAVNIALRQAVGRVVFCVTKDTIVVAAADDGAAAALWAPGSTPPRLPAIAPLGAGRVAVVLGATDWTRDDGEPVLLDEELPAVARKVISATEKADPLDQSANDIEAIGVALLEFVRPFVDDIHYKLDLAADEPLIEVLLAGYAEDYGPEIWDLRYRVQQRNLGNDYWSTRPLRPSYYQLYPPEKGRPRTFIEAQYPAKLPPLGLARAAQSDPAVIPIRNSSPEISAAVTAILNGESNKADTRPAEDFLRLALPVVAGAQAKLAIAAVDQRYRFQWLLTPENAPPAPAETGEPERPSLRKGGPPMTR